MKRADLKRLMKPLIRECIHEVLVGEGILAKVVSEVAKGMGNVIVENRQTTPEPPISSNNNEAAIKQQKQKLQEARKRLTNSIGSSAYSNIFEGVTATPAPSDPQAGSLSGVEPSDPGIDISGLFAHSGHHWQALAKGPKG